ncbi:DUF4403 family protein [Patescibacteria group bacterium]|nr:DUF4403 family protein [Patescibacteria group bacterium]
MIDFEVYLEQRKLNDNGGLEIQGRQIVGSVQGRGEYVTRDEGGRRLHVKDIEAGNTGTKQVSLCFEGRTKGTIYFDTHGNGRLPISEESCLIVRDRTISYLK